MAKEGFKRKMSAIFSADVQGYSRLMGEDEAATVSTITTYRGVMSDLVGQHRGRIVDSPGDNVLAEFASVVDAVQCAVAIQKEVQSRNAGMPADRKMEFRIGINLGDVIEEDDRIYGDGVNIAARLETLADPGGICISKTAFDHIESKLPLGYEDIGEQIVKNITKPVTAYKVLMDPRITVSGDGRKRRALPTWSIKSALAGGITIAIVAMAISIWSFYLGGRLTNPATDGRASIAVLPFKSMSNDSELEHFSDGLTEELIGALAKISGMKVISQTSAFSYKGKDVDLRSVGRELMVANVLEGSVRKSGNRLRITAQLISVADDTHLWSETYEREMKDTFGIQDEISQTVAKSLRAQLLDSEDEEALQDYVRRVGVGTMVEAGETIEDGLSAFGANVEIAGTVIGGLEAFGANIEVSGTNQGDMRYAGANVILSGRFLDVVDGLSANLIISGTFEKDLEVQAARIIIEPTAVIKGDFAYATPLLERKEGSQIMGQVIRLDSEKGEIWSGIRHPLDEGDDDISSGMFWFIATFALIIVGLLIHLCLPKQTEEIVSAIGDSFWRNLGMGLFFLIVVPLAIIALLLTVIGIPAGIILIFLTITMIYVSRVYVNLWLGRLLLGRFKESLGNVFFLPFLAGTLITSIMLLIPTVSWFLRVLFALMGSGAMARVMWVQIRSVRKTLPEGRENG